MGRYTDAAHEAYQRLVAARRIPRTLTPEEDTAQRRRAKLERENAMIRRRLPRVS